MAEPAPAWCCGRRAPAWSSAAWVCCWCTCSSAATPRQAPLVRAFAVWWPRWFWFGLVAALLSTAWSALPRTSPWRPLLLAAEGPAAARHAAPDGCGASPRAACSPPRCRAAGRPARAGIAAGPERRSGAGANRVTPRRALGRRVDVRGQGRAGHGEHLGATFAQLARTAIAVGIDLCEPRPRQQRGHAPARSA